MSNSKAIDEVRKKIQMAYEKLSGPKYTKKFAESVVEDVRKRTRLGYGVDNNLGKKKPLKPINAKTIEDRKNLSEKGQLHPNTSPGRSNLTRSGQLLDSLVALGLNKEFIVEVQDFRNDGKTNSQIVEGQEKQGRSFLYITDLEQKRLNDLVKKSILEEIRK